MRRLTFCLMTILVLAGAVPARAQAPRGKAMKVAIASSLLAHAADISTTMYALGRRPDLFREANPLLRPLTSHPAAFGMTKMGVAVTVNYLLFRASAGHPKAAFWAGVASTALTAYAAHHNAVEIGRLP